MKNMNTLNLQNNLKLSSKSIISKLETSWVNVKFKFKPYELSKIRSQNWDSLLEKIINIYKANSNELVVTDIKNKIDSTFWVNKWQSLQILGQKKQNFELIKQSITKLETYIRSSKIQQTMALLKVDSNGKVKDKGMRMYLGYYGINPNDILNWIKVANPSNELPVQFLNDLADIFKAQKEMKELETKIENWNIDNLVDYFIKSSTSIDTNNLKNLSTRQIEFLDKSINNLSSINLDKLKKIVGKDSNDLSLQDIAIMKKIDISSLTKFLVILDTAWIIQLDTEKVKKLRKVVLITVKSIYADQIVNGNSYITKQKTWNIINRKTKVNISVDDIQALDMLTIDKKKMLEKLNADEAFKWIMFMLLDFKNKAKTYLGGESQLFKKIKEAFVDYKKQDWYKTLDDNTKNQFMFIENILKLSKNYNEFKEKLKLGKKKQERAKNLILLLDTYSKWMLWKGITPKNYKKLVKDILELKFNNFLNKYEKLYKKIQSDAQGSYWSWSDYGLAKIFGDDTHTILDFKKVKQLFNDTNSNFLDGVSLYSTLNKLIKNMEDEKTVATVKENLWKYNISTLLVKEYEKSNSRYKLEIKNWNKIYKWSATELIIQSDNNVKFKWNSSIPSYMDESFKESSQELSFKNESIKLSNWLPKWFYDRLLKTYPWLVDSPDNTAEQIELFKKFKKQFLVIYKTIKYIKETVQWVVPITLLEQFGTYSYILFGKTNYNLLWWNNISFVKEKREQINLDNIQLWEKQKKQKKQLNKIVEKQWKLMPLYQRQLLCKKIDWNICNDELSPPPDVKDILVNKTFNKILLTKKAEMEFVLLNANNKSLKDDLHNLLEVTTEDKISKYIENLAKEIIPFVIAEILWTILDFSWVFAWAGIAMQAWGVWRMARLLWTWSNYLVRYGVVEAWTYTVTSNLINWSWSIFEGYGHNAMYYLVLPAFGKLGWKLWTTVTLKWVWEMNKLSSALWVWWTSIVGLEWMNYMVNWKLDISQIPNDMLFMLLLHGTSKWIEWTREFVKTKTWVDVKGMVWNPEGRGQIIDSIRTETWKTLEGAKSAYWKTVDLPKNISARSSFTKEVKWKDIVWRLEDGTSIFKDKDGNFYSYKKVKTFKYSVDKSWNRLIDKNWKFRKESVIKYEKKKLNLEGANIGNLETIAFEKWNTLVWRTKDGKFIIMEKEWNKLIEKQVFDINTQFKDFVNKLEELKIFEWNNNSSQSIETILEQKWLSETDLKKLESILNVSKLDPTYREEIMEELNRIKNMSDAEIKSLWVYQKTKEFFLEKFKKDPKNNSKSESEIDQEAENEALKVTKKGLKRTLQFMKTVLIKFPLSVVRKTLKYGAIAILFTVAVGWWWLLYDEHSWGKWLDTAEKFIKEHFGWIAWAVWWRFVWKTFFGSSTLWKIFTTILGSYIWHSLNKK